MVISKNEARLELARQRDETLTDLMPLETSKIPQFYDPQQVINLGLQLESSRLDPLEHLSIVEQTLIAAAEIGNLELANEQYRILKSKLPEDYSRMKKLKGILMEASGNISGAQELYDDHLKSNPTDIVIQKRLIMTYAQNNQRMEAISKLVSYLDVVMQDVEAWVTLAHLYLDECMYQQAIFCFEELLLLRPGEPAYMLRYADAVAMIGRYELAFKFYCAVIEIVPQSLHAWYGIHSIASVIISGDVKTKSKDYGLSEEESLNLDNVKDLFSISKEQIRKLNASASKTIKSAVESYLE